jgi:4-amino-4-deoxy-L-arabinose transferase-like glycosyltransferase
LWAEGRWLNPTSDPGAWWTLIVRVGSGERIYRDVYVQYGPLGPYLFAALLKPFDYSAASFLILNAVLAVAAGVLLLRVARPYLSLFERLVLAVLLVGVGILAPGRAKILLSYSPAAVFGVCLGLAALLLLCREPAGRVPASLAGLLAGLAFAAKQEVGIAALAALLLPVALRWRRAGAWGLPVVVGFAIPAAAAAAFAVASAPLESLRHDSHVWPVGTVPESWKFLYRLTTGLTFDWPQRVLWASAGVGAALLLVALVGLLVSGDTRVRRGFLLLALAALVAAVAAGFRPIVEGWDPLCLSLFAAAAVGLLALFDRNLPGREALASYAVFAGMVGARAGFSGGLLWSSYSGLAGLVAAASWAFLLFLSPSIAPGGRAGVLARRILAVALLLVALPGAVRGVRMLRRPEAVPVDTARGRVWLDPPFAPFFATLARNLHPGESVLSVPESNGIEALYRVRGAAPYMDLMPGWLDARAEEGLIGRFGAAPPDAVVVFRRPTQEFGVAPFGEGYGERLAPWITSHYRLDEREDVGLLFRR